MRLERLRVKLRRRGGLELLTTAEGRADAALHEALSEHLRLPPTTPWLLDERVLSLMVPLLREPASTQRVATLLLRRRAGPPPGTCASTRPTRRSSRDCASAASTRDPGWTVRARR